MVVEELFARFILQVLDWIELGRNRHVGVNGGLRICHHKVDYRTAHLRPRRHCKGGETVRHQDRAIDLYTFMNIGLLAALAGLVFAARLNTATPKAGLGFELDVIAACFIGGAPASGGVGKVLDAVFGAFIMGVMNNGMSIMGIGIDYQQVIKGLVLLAGVCVDVYKKNK